MKHYEIINIQEQPELCTRAANWFHEKWEIPMEAYLESMNEGMKGEEKIPQWYAVLCEHEIVGGLGVIENDFHNRKDLTPNICALYVEETHRCQGIAGKLLNFVCGDMKKRGISTLYLITDHTSFYERYDWKFLCMVQGDGEAELTRMYIHEEL